MRMSGFKYWLGFIGMFSFRVVLIAQQTQLMTPEIRGYLNAYYDAIETSDPQKGLIALNNLIAADPGYANYYGARASVLAAIDTIDKTRILQDLNRAVELDSINPAHREQRYAFTQTIGTDVMRMLSLLDIVRLIEHDSLNSDHYFSWYHLAPVTDTALLATIRARSIQSAYAQVLQFPDSAQYWYVLAQAYLLGDEILPEEDLLLAQAYLTQAIEISPQRDFLIARARLYVSQHGDIAAALTDYRKALQYSPTDKQYAECIRLLLASKQKQEARETWNKAKLIYPLSYSLEALKKEVK